MAGFSEIDFATHVETRLTFSCTLLFSGNAITETGDRKIFLREFCLAVMRNPQHICLVSHQGSRFQWKVNDLHPEKSRGKFVPIQRNICAQVFQDQTFLV